ncbi:tubulin nucleotide-binding domain-like protein [Dentipellis sp. KUC8613]|nr:tubulin nucleotide-binding domain-like protein [Dentipellis sp. KUC8613]
MKEILYIQAGQLSNHIGTHFWNAQQSYFTYDEDEEVVVDHDVSFREGISPQGEVTFCPRLLVFDRKANFGTLGRTNDLYTEESTDEPSALWSGAVEDFRRDPIPKSTYQSHLNEEVAEDPAALRKAQDEKAEHVPALRATQVRYWSDYNRVYYAPRTIQALPDALTWENLDSDWQSGRELFQRYNAETSLMEEPFRSFVEECDTPQGIQLTVDNDTFGSFADALLSTFRDEYPKLPALTFSILSNAVPGHIDADDPLGIRRAVNDATCLRGLQDLSTIAVPIQNPYTWSAGKWLDHLTADLRSPYEVGAILSAHAETATLPLRCRGTLLSELCVQMNPYSNPPFAELWGAFPVLTAADFDTRMQNFTCKFTLSEQERELLCRSDVLRGVSDEVQRRAEEWQDSDAVQGALIRRSLAYPMPTSFPSFFRAPHLNADLRRTPRGIVAPPRAAPMVSSFALSAGTPDLFSRYATFVERCVRTKVDWQLVGADVDDVRDLVNDLWTLSDSFGERGSGLGGGGAGSGADDDDGMQ